MATVNRTGLAPRALHGVTYDEYVKYRDDPKNAGLRMTYRDGWFVFMSPRYRHERPSAYLAMIVRSTAAVFSIPYLESASTTFRKGKLGTRRGSGKEPDQSFYFAHLPAIRNRDTIELPADPPPDLWIGVDNRVSSQGRLPIYADLGVPEVWRFRAGRKTLWFGRLVDGRYEEIERSLNLPMLTSAIVLELLANSAIASDQGTWDEQTRDWLRRVLKPAYESRA